MTTTRQGPALTITGTCEGCCYLGRSIVARSCHSPLLGEPCLLPRAEDATIPAWCPLLPAARLALARRIVADSAPDGVFAMALDLWKAREQDPARGVASVFCEPWLSLAEMHDRLKCEGAPAVSADECSATHGAGKSEE